MSILLKTMNFQFVSQQCSVIFVCVKSHSVYVKMTPEKRV